MVRAGTGATSCGLGFIVAATCASPASAACGLNRLAHHGLALADVTLERESRLLEHGPRAVVEERGRRLLARGELVGERNHLAPAGLGDQLERAIQSLPRHSRTSVVAVDEEAGDAP